MRCVAAGWMRWRRGKIENGAMTQDERWQARYKEVVGFIETNHRNPSKYEGAERVLVNWVKQQRKLMNSGLLIEPRLSSFKELLALSEQYKRVNQWGPPSIFLREAYLAQVEQIKKE